MKNFFKLFAVAVLGLTMMTACKGGDEGQIEDAGNAYIKAMVAKDADAAKALATEETKDVVDAIFSFAPDQFKEGMTVSNIKVDGETATAEVAKEGEPMIMNFKKVDGKWLVEAAKETGDMSMGEEMGEEAEDAAEEVEELAEEAAEEIAE